MQVPKPGTGCPGRLWRLLPPKSPRAACAQRWAPCSGCPCWSSGWTRRPQRSPPPSAPSVPLAAILFYFKQPVGGQSGLPAPARPRSPGSSPLGSSGGAGRRRPAGPAGGTEAAAAPGRGRAGPGPGPAPQPGPGPAPRARLSPGLPAARTGSRLEGQKAAYAALRMRGWGQN